MELLKAFILSLGEVEEPILTRYRLGVILHTLYRDKVYKGEKLRAQKEWATYTEFRNRLGQLEREGVLKSNSSYGPAGIYEVLGRKSESSEEIICSIDPFCYLSHLSAMAHHGLTLRIPTTLFTTSPTPQEWATAARKKMAKDLHEEVETYLENGLPPLIRLNIKKIKRYEIHRFTSSHRGGYVNARGGVLRVASIGTTFLDMLRNPELCGGMHHVVETYQEYAAQYLPLIVDEIDQRGAPIDKVRAGYLLDEVVNVSHEALERWAEFAQRGGSRKLDASGEYVPEWSEKWCLSLNL